MRRCACRVDVLHGIGATITSGERALTPKADSAGAQIFLSYSGADAFEAGLLQYAAERMLAPLSAAVWTYQRDQPTDQRDVAVSLKEQVRQSAALVFLLTPTTLVSGAAQWMELAYADAYYVPIWVLLHRVPFTELRARESGVPPFLLAGQCNPATEWKRVIHEIEARLTVIAKPGE